MHAAAVTLTVLLLLEVVPSAVAQLARARAGLERLDELTRLGLLQGRHPRIPVLLGSLHALGAAAVIAGLWRPPLGVAGAALEAAIFAWTLYRQLRAGDRGRALGAYLLFLSMALAVLVVNAAR
ncbi:DoxX family protein [Streptomyces sp. NPDC046977]|uniref:DoxX family protein n=1 Tax=Streptomyces sp. NPDC046977 TaxID=3154703 RepID=UPI0033D3F6C9